MLFLLVAVFLALNIPQRFQAGFMEFFSDLFEQLERFNSLRVELQNTLVYATYVVTFIAPMAPKHYQTSMMSMFSNLASPLGRLSSLGLDLRDSFCTFLIPDLALQLLYILQHTRKLRLP